MIALLAAAFPVLYNQLAMKIARILLGITIATSVAVAQGRGGRGGNPNGAPAEANPATQVRTGQPPVEKSVVTRHKARIGGQEISYTATAATYIIRNDDGRAEGDFLFRRLYEGRRRRTRPSGRLSFVYNGGPGSASLLHAHGTGAAAHRAHRRRPWNARAVLDRGQRRLVSGRDRHGVHRRGVDRLQPSGAGPESRRSSTAWCRTRPFFPISSINTSRATSAGRRPSSCWAKATGPRDRRSFRACSSTVMRCI